MENMLLLLGSAEGAFLFTHIFLRQFLPLVHAALANCPHLAAGDFHGLAEEADRILLSHLGSYPFTEWRWIPCSWLWRARTQ